MKKLLIAASLICIGIAGCAKQEEKIEVQKTEQGEQKRMLSAEEMAKITSDIDARHKQIESQLANIQPIQTSTNGLREQIHQKWSAINAYMLDNQIVRIITVPHTNITNRTEEFYFDNGKLILALIQDKGPGTDPAKEQSSKSYYFNDDQVIKEINNSSETEYSIRNSDGERLLQEAREYMQILKK
jgi:hypothetical protein